MKIYYSENIVETKEYKNKTFLIPPKAIAFKDDYVITYYLNSSDFILYLTDINDEDFLLKYYSDCNSLFIKIFNTGKEKLELTEKLFMPVMFNNKEILNEAISWINEKIPKSSDLKFIKLNKNIDRKIKTSASMFLNQEGNPQYYSIYALHKVLYSIKHIEDDSIRIKTTLYNYNYSSLNLFAALFPDWRNEYYLELIDYQDEYVPFNIIQKLKQLVVNGKEYGAKNE